MNFKVGEINRDKKLFLAIDIGNTKTKFALFLDDKIVFKDSIPTGIASSLFEKIRERPSEICIASVVPKVNPKILNRAKTLGITPRFVSYDKIKTSIKNPEKIGQDRIANVLGALDQYKPPIIIVDLGTATVFDCINKDSIYIGGAILPGIEISISSLFKRCALLSPVEIKEPKSLIGDDTKSAIQSGIFYGAIEQIDGMTRRIKRRIKGAMVIGTGGIDFFLPHLKGIDLIDFDLTLKGIRQYALS
ncbi:MAG: type III pantothenate kinase [bacterium]